MVVRETIDQKYSEKDGCDRFHEICNLKKNFFLGYLQVYSRQPS